MADSIGERFVHAVAHRDRDTLTSILDPHVDFRAVTPRRFWEGENPDAVIDAALGHWFGESDHIDCVRSVETGEDVGDVHRVGYRFHITNGDGPSAVEQQAYYRVADGRISYLRIVCSGYQPRAT